VLQCVWFIFYPLRLLSLYAVPRDSRVLRVAYRRELFVEVEQTARPTFIIMSNSASLMQVTLGIICRFHNTHRSREAVIKYKIYDILTTAKNLIILSVVNFMRYLGDFYGLKCHIDLIFGEVEEISLKIARK